MRIGSSKNNNLAGKIITLVILAAVALFFLVAMQKGIKVKMDDKSIAISGGLMYSDKIDYSKVNKVELRDKVDYGNRDNGMDMFSMEAGFYSNSEFGKYKLYVYTKTNKYIVMTYDNNKVAVFNDKDSASTEKLYKDLDEKIKK